MSTDPNKKRNTLEEQFFAKLDQELLARMREGTEQDRLRDDLRKATNITDDGAIDALAAQGVTADTLAAMMIVPLVQVAWADGKVSPEEKRAILEAAHHHGINRDTAGHNLIEHWLSNQPDESLYRAWHEYTSALAATLDEMKLVALEAEILGLARKVAESAGSFLGITSAVSDAERKVLSKLKRAFQK